MWVAAAWCVLVCAAAADNSTREADAIIGAEHDRDVAMARGSAGSSLGAGALDVTSGELRKQLNQSSAMLDGLMRAETGRDESLTDIQHDETRRDYVELVALNATRRALNESSYEAEDADADSILSVLAGFTDVQTVFVACGATLLPLMLALLLLLVARCAVRRACRARAPSTATDSDKQDIERDEYKPMSSPSGVVDGGEYLPTPLPSNGSIITMTLKNNHLTVETEERNDIVKKGRETTMRYSPDEDGVFVVEVQQSADMVGERGEKTTDRLEYGKAAEQPRSWAGLATSRLSISSEGSAGSTQGYAYGAQAGYERAPRGYAEYLGYSVPELGRECSREPLLPPADPDRPVVTAAVLKQDSIAGDAPDYCLEGCSDGPLLSDVQAREVSLQRLHDTVYHDTTIHAINTANHVNDSVKHVIAVDISPGVDLKAVDDDVIVIDNHLVDTANHAADKAKHDRNGEHFLNEIKRHVKGSESHVNGNSNDVISSPIRVIKETEAVSTCDATDVTTVVIVNESKGATES